MQEVRKCQYIPDSPSWLHTVVASLTSHPLSHTVPQKSSRQISTLPLNSSDWASALPSLSSPSWQLSYGLLPNVHNQIELSNYSAVYHSSTFISPYQNTPASLLWLQLDLLIWRQLSNSCSLPLHLHLLLMMAWLAAASPKKFVADLSRSAVNDYDCSLS